MKFRDIKTKDSKELVQVLNELQQKLLQLHFDHVDKKLKDYSQLRKTKKAIAQVLTLLHTTK